MAEGLEKYVEEHAKEFRVVAEQRDVDKPLIDRALELVRQFIVERNLILYGGQAIDYALRTRGAAIYLDEQRPDLDFMSPNSIDDAYDLAERLHTAGFPRVVAIRAIHVQTMRVRTNFISVADVSYVPKAVFDRIPTLTVAGGLRVVSPDYQRIDMHLAFCFPYNDPPREDVFNRWRKDLTRFNLLTSHFPIELVQPQKEFRPVRATLAADSIVAAAPSMTVALHGFAAYNALRLAFSALCATLGIEDDHPAPRHALTFPDSDTVEAEVPNGTVTCVAVNAQAVAGPGCELYEPYTDAIPASARRGSLETLSIDNRLLSACSIATTTGAGLAGFLRVVSPQYLLAWLLCQHFRTGELVYREYYCHAMSVIEAAEELFAEAGNSVPEEALRAFGASPFAPTIDCIGTANTNASYTIRVANTIAQLGDVPPAGSYYSRLILEETTGLPRSTYDPSDGRGRAPYDYRASRHFRHDGSRI